MFYCVWVIIFVDFCNSYFVIYCQDLKLALYIVMCFIRVIFSFCRNFFIEISYTV